MKKYLLLIFLLFYSIVIVKAQAITPTGGDYRTAASGNWSATSSWQVRDGIGGWTTAVSLPTSTSNVFIQRGHTITVDIAAASCSNLNLDLNGVLTIGNNFVSIYNRIRAYGATLATLGAVDGTFYTDTASQITLNATMVTSSVTGGLKFVGTTRNLNYAYDWNSNGTGNVSVVFALDAGAIGTINAGFKAKTYIVQSGIVAAASGAFISAGAIGTGTSFLIKNGAKFTTQRSGITNSAIGFSSAKKCDNITIESGGVLEFNASTPTVDCKTFTNNGTVIYLAGAGTLVTPTTNGVTDTAANITSYKTLVLGGSGLKTIPASLNITVSDTLRLEGTSSCVLALGVGSSLTYGANATLVYNFITGTATLTAASVEWPLINGPKNLEFRKNTVQFTASTAGNSRMISGGIYFTGGSFNVSTGDSLYMANGSTLTRKSATGGLTTSGIYLIGTIATDQVTVIIDNNSPITETKELQPNVTNGKLNLTITAGSTYTAGGRSIYNFNNSGVFVMGATGFIINGDILGTGTISGNAAYSLTINGSGATTSPLNFTAGFENLLTLTINRSGVGSTVAMGTNLTIATDLFLTAGVFNDNGKTINVTRHISYSGTALGTGTHVSGSGGKIVMLCNYGTQSAYYIGSTSLGNLEFNFTAYKLPRAATSFSVENLSFAQSNKKFNLYGYNVTIKKDLTGIGVDSIINSGNLTPTAYAHLIMSGASNTISGITVMDTLEIASGANITSSATFSVKKMMLYGNLNDGGNIITNTGDLIGTGSHFGTGRIAMTGAGKTVSGNGLSLGNFEIATGSLNTITTLNNLAVTQNLLLTTGTLIDGGNTITVGQNLTGTSGKHTGTGEIKMMGANNTVSNVIVDSLEIAASANITANSAIILNKGLYLLGSLNDGGNFISIAGNIFGSGTHTGTGMIKMTGSSKSINGRPTLNNVEIVTGASTSAGFGAIITGILYLNGGNIAVDSSNGAPNTLTFKNNSSVIRTTGNLNINGGIVQMGTTPSDVISVIINGNLASTNELPSTHVGNIDLTINDGFSYTIKSNSKFVRNLNVSNGHLLCAFDTLTQTGYNLLVNNQATVSGDFYLDSIQYDYPGNTSGPFKVGPSLIINGNGVLKFGNVNNKTLFSNGLLVLKSKNFGTASVGDVTNGGVNSGNKITGVTTVERFISNIRDLSTNSDPTVKAWRILSMPTKHDYQTIKQAWQEGGSLNSNPVPGYGIQITSNGSNWASDGFDTLSNGPSMKYFDPVSNSYGGILTTNAPFEQGKAYMVFVRGSRAKTQLNQIPDTTTIREKGTLNVGDTTVTIGSGANQFVCVANPYPSAIDFWSLPKNNLTSYLYLYDPRLNAYGAFQTITSNGVAVPGGGSYLSGVNNIQSSQGFFVKTTTDAGSITFKETSKQDGSSLTFRSNESISSLNVNVLKSINNHFEIADGVMHIFETNANNAVDNQDAVKFNNFYENISIKTANHNLAIENRNLILANDTFFYQIGLKANTYQLQFVPEHIQLNGILAFLEDSYSSSSIPVSLTDTTWIDFTVNADAGSFAPNRFRLVFKPMAVLPLSFTDVTALIKNKNVLVSWKVSNELNIHHYTIEKSIDGVSFVALGNKESLSTSGISTSYNHTDVSPIVGMNYYRIKSIGNAGEIKYSKTVKVDFISGDNSFTISPNPVGLNRELDLDLKKLSGGKYELSLFDFSGRKVFTSSWENRENNNNTHIKLPGNLSSGSYRLCLKNSSDNYCESLIIK